MLNFTSADVKGSPLWNHTLGLTARPPTTAAALWMKLRRVFDGAIPAGSGRSLIRAFSSRGYGFLFPDLSRVAQRTQQGKDEPTREIARDIPDIGARYHF